MHTLSVSSLNEQIKSLLEQSFSRVLVEGELSRITYHSSGHVYFSIKDDESVLKAVIFKANAAKLKFTLEEGLKVTIDAALSVYKPRGEYQLNCFSIQPSGFGELSLAYEQLKKELNALGYFDEARKKPLPKFPKKIAFITSATGAALQDMLRVANSRYKNIDIDLYDVLVQGDMASFAIEKALNEANKSSYDAIVLARGGGSIEDLWAFNEKRVADAIFASKIPVISAIGHEIDWVISDFVADVRAATPSAAMEMLLPDTNELFLYIDSLATQLEQRLKTKLNTLVQELEHTKQIYKKHSVEQKIIFAKDEARAIKRDFNALMEHKISVAKSQVDMLTKMLQSQNPKTKSSAGFAQISKNGTVLSLSKLSVDDDFILMDRDVKVEAKVLNKESL